MFRRRDSATAHDMREQETMATRVEMPRRMLDVPVAPSAFGQQHLGGAATGRVAVGADTGPVLVHDGHDHGCAEAAARRQLTVGPGIRLQGQIDGCERLAIAGEVKADLEKTAHLVIGESGRLDGQGEVETADIAGSFDGTLVVRGRLLIRATGRVKGDIRFGELEIERGGQLAGTVDANVKGPQLAPVAAAGGDD